MVRFPDGCRDDSECRWAVYAGCGHDRFVAVWGPGDAMAVTVLEREARDAAGWRAIAVEKRNADPDNDYVYPRRHRFAAGYEPVASWHYEMSATADGVSRHCTGAAEVAAGTHLVSWQLLDTRCTGDPAADWLHAETRTAAIVAVYSGWQLEANLPSGASCTPNVPRQEGAPPRDVRLDCRWCSGQASPCSGGASYRWSSAPPQVRSR